MASAPTSPSLCFPEVKLKAQFRVSAKALTQQAQGYVQTNLNSAWIGEQRAKVQNIRNEKAQAKKRLKELRIVEKNIKNAIEVTASVSNAQFDIDSMGLTEEDTISLSLSEDTFDYECDNDPFTTPVVEDVFVTRDEEVAVFALKKTTPWKDEVSFFDDPTVLLGNETFPIKMAGGLTLSHRPNYDGWTKYAVNSRVDSKDPKLRFDYLREQVFNQNIKHEFQPLTDIQHSLLGVPLNEYYIEANSNPLWDYSFCINLQDLMNGTTVACRKKSGWQYMPYAVRAQVALRVVLILRNVLSDVHLVAAVNHYYARGNDELNNVAQLQSGADLVVKMLNGIGESLQAAGTAVASVFDFPVKAKNYDDEPPDDFRGKGFVAWVKSLAELRWTDVGTDVNSWVADKLLGLVGSALLGAKQLKVVLYQLLELVGKFMVRYALGYNTNQMIAEVLMAGLDMGGGLSSLIHNTPKMQAHDPAGGILAVMMSGAMFAFSRSMGIDSTIIRDLTMNQRLLTPLMPNDVASWVAHLPVVGSLIQFLSNDESVEDVSPAAVRFHSWQLSILDEVEVQPWLCTKFHELHIAYVRELATLPMSQQTYWKRKMSMVPRPEWLQKPPPQTHNQARVIYVQGKPGHGKTVSSYVELDAVISYCISQGFFRADSNIDDNVYNMTAGKKHMDGYRGQKIIMFNDFLSAKEKAGAESMAAMLLALADSAPFMPSFAGMNQKGLAISVVLIVIPSNVPWENFPTLLGASNNPEAYYRRISYYFEMRAKKFDSVLGQMEFEPDRGSDQYNFMLHADRNHITTTTHVMSIYDVITIMCACIQQHFITCTPAQGAVDCHDHVASLTKKKVPEFKVQEVIVYDPEEIIDLKPLMERTKLAEPIVAAPPKVKTRLNVKKQKRKGEKGVRRRENFRAGIPVLQGFTDDDETPLIIDYESSGEEDCEEMMDFDHSDLHTYDEYGEPVEYYENFKYKIDEKTKLSEIELTPQEEWHKLMMEFYSDGLTEFSWSRYFVKNYLYRTLPKGVGQEGYDMCPFRLKEVWLDKEEGCPIERDELSKIEPEWYTCKYDTLNELSAAMEAAQTQKFDKKKIVLTGFLICAVLMSGMVIFHERSKIETIRVEEEESVREAHEYALLHNPVLQNVTLSALKKNNVLFGEEFRSSLKGEFAQREKDQINTVARSIVLVEDQDGTRLSKGFMLSDQELLIPQHVYLAIEKKGQGFRINKNGIVNKFKTGTKSVQFTAVTVTGHMTHVRLWMQTIQGCTDHTSKFPTEVGTDLGEELFRVDETGVVDPQLKSLGIASVPIQGRMETVLQARPSVKTVTGDCGSMYFRRTTDNQKMVGMHIAANNSVQLSPITQVVIDYMRTQQGGSGPRAGVAFHDVPELQMTKAEEVFGYPAQPTKEFYGSLQRTSKLVEVPGMCEDRKGSFFNKAYGVVDLGMTDGVPNEAKRFVRHVEKEKLRREGKDKLASDEVIAEVCQMIGDPMEDFVLGWDSAVSSEVLNPVQRMKSAGGRWPGKSKWIFFEKDSEIPVLLPEVKEQLDELIDDMDNGKKLLFIRALIAKDEKLLLHKVERPRLYAPDDFLLFVLCRAYFASTLGEMGKRGRTYGIFANMDPEETAREFAKFRLMNIASFDQISQDASHDVASWIDLARILLGTVWKETNLGGKKFFHPNLPLLSVVNYRRCMIMEHLWSSPFLYQNYILYFFGTLASGCLLTFVINCMSLLKAFATLRVELKKLGFTEQINRGGLQIAIFGDDNWLICSNEFMHMEMIDMWLECCEKYDFFMSIGGGWAHITDHMFCGRFWSPHDFYGCTMALENDRLTKIIQFTKKRKMGENYPQQVSTYVQECLRLSKEDYKVAISHLRVGPHKLSVYCTWLSDYKKIHQRGLCTKWQDGRSFDSELRQAVISWMGDFIDYAEDFYEPELQMEAPETGAEVPADEENHDESLTTINTEQEIEEIAMTEGERNLDESFFVDSTNQYFSRPIQLGVVNWTTLQSVNAELVNLDLPGDYFRQNPNAQMKLANTLGMVVEVEVTFILNTVATQAGLLLAYASPMARKPSDVYEISTGPNAHLSAGSRKAVRVIVPYNRDATFLRTAYFNTANEGRNFNFCKVGLRVLSILNSVNAGTAQVQVWVALRKARVMQGAITAFTIDPQGFNGLVSETIQKTSGVMSMAGRAVSSLSGMVETSAPLLTAASALFGFDKPTLGPNASMFKEQGGVYMCNGDATDLSQTMAMRLDTKLIPNPGVFSDSVKDPMDINYQCSREGLVIVAPYTVNDSAQTILFTLPVVPGLRQNQAFGTPFVPTPTSFVCSLFAFTRQTMIYRFVLAKTAFHSGTIEVSVNYESDTLPTTGVRSALLHRVIWDVTEQDQLIVKVPYVNHYHYRPYIDVRPGDFVENAPVLTVKAIVPLTASDTVGSTIDVLCFVSSEDVECAFPIVQYSETQVEVELLSEERSNMRPVPQGPYDVEGTEHPLGEVVILASGSPFKTDAESAVRVISERVTTLASLLRRFQLLRRSNYSSSVLNEVYNFRDEPFPVMHKLIAQLFVFGVGGFRLKVVLAEDVYFQAFAQVAEDSENTVGVAEVIQADSAKVLEITQPAIYPKNVYPVNEISGRYYTPELGINMRNKSGIHLVYFAFDDSGHFGGMNYLKPVTALAAEYAGNIPNAPVPQ